MSKDKEGLEEVTLPYDFISLPNKYITRYDDINQLPKYNEINEDTQSGYIEYTIEQNSKLAVEIRSGYADKKYLSSSMMKGLTRSNAEILSCSFPMFVDRSNLLYRDLSSKNYIERLLKNDKLINEIKDTAENEEKSETDKSIEKNINVGFLSKVNNEYHIVPAKSINNKNFKSIKEIELKEIESKNKDVSFNKIYEWDSKIEKEMVELCNEIKMLDKIIKDEREEHIDIIEKNQKMIDEKFSKFSFNNKKIRNKIRSIKKKEEKQQQKLRQELRQKLEEIEELKDCGELINNYVERWCKKFELEIKYNIIKRNKGFEPYQNEVKINEQKYILFNSSNACSKRTHYLINAEKEENCFFVVKEAVITTYNKNLEKFRDVNKGNGNVIKDFNDIFNNYEKLCDKLSNSKSTHLPIVFYKLENGEVVNVGRTPYFKVNHRKQIGDLLKDNTISGIDYAGALFGFSMKNENASNDEMISYKSRVRFSPIKILSDLDPNNNKVVENLILLTPQASAEGMYLKQNVKKKKVTYEDEECELNGYKYYHVLDEVINASKKDNVKTTTKKRYIEYDKENKLTFKGRIYFKNLNDDELGLLILSVDISKLKLTQKYKKLIKNKNVDECYELIGGAKPYGYGKTKIRIEELMIEKKDNGFESLIVNSFDKKNNYEEYIDSFLANLSEKNQDFLTKQFNEYIVSKQPIQKREEHYNWENLDKNGYKKNWILKKDTKKMMSYEEKLNTFINKVNQHNKK